MEQYFDTEALEKIKHSYNNVFSEYNDLLLKYNQFNFSNNQAEEYALQGLMRRIKILKRCIVNIFEITPPENRTPLVDDKSTDLSINLQSFILNTYGCLDNIAWVWIKEKNINLKPIKVGLKPKYKELRNTLSIEFKDYLSKFDSWFEYIENYRDALAHRIPLLRTSIFFDK